MPQAKWSLDEKDKPTIKCREYNLINIVKKEVFMTINVNIIKKGFPV